MISYSAFSLTNAYAQGSAARRPAERTVTTPHSARLATCEPGLAPRPHVLVTNGIPYVS